MAAANADRFQLFVDGVKDYAFIQFDADSRITDWNQGAERLLGYTEQEILGQSAAIFFTPEDRANREPERETQTARRDGTAEDERWHLRKNGSRFRASGVLTRICDDQGDVVGFVKVMRDVTEREQARERLERSLVEKEALLREIHHRVKNNLQVIVSLLAVQARYLDDSEAVASLEETINRVRAIARIHETLYREADLVALDFATYLRQLAHDLTSFYDPKQRLTTNVEASSLSLEIERAVPLALIANELIGNAMKHAFTNGHAGSVHVKLSSDKSFSELEVTDNGIGLPSNFQIDLDGGMGFNLVQILTEQMEAQLRIKSEGGTQVSVRFPLHPAA
jgi:PAS domain S-box-containing protein